MPRTLVPEKVEKIRELASQGVPTTTIADNVDTSVAAVNRVLKNKTVDGNGHRNFTVVVNKKTPVKTPNMTVLFKHVGKVVDSSLKLANYFQSN